MRKPQGSVGLGGAFGRSVTPEVAGSSPVAPARSSVRRYESVRNYDRLEVGHLAAGDSIDPNGVERRVAGRRDPEAAEDPVRNPGREQFPRHRRARAVRASNRVEQNVHRLSSVDGEPIRLPTELLREGRNEPRPFASEKTDRRARVADDLSVGARTAENRRLRIEAAGDHRDAAAKARAEVMQQGKIGRAAEEDPVGARPRDRSGQAWGDLWSRLSAWVTSTLPVA